MVHQVTNGLADVNEGFVDGVKVVAWEPCVHNDLKPANILVTYEGPEGSDPIFKITDFGSSSKNPR